MYKNERKRYFDQDPSLIDPIIKKDYENWDNLLNFLPSSVFYG